MELKKWRTRVLIEGHKEAMFMSQYLGCQGPDPSFDGYPVDVVLPKKHTLWGAFKEASYLGSRCIYNMICKIKD